MGSNTSPVVYWHDMDINEFKIAAAQSTSIAGDIVENVRRHAVFVRKAHDHDACVVVFPELSLTGYEPPIALKAAITRRDSVLLPLQNLSNELGMMIIAGCPIPSSDGKPFLGAFIVRPGRPIDVYRKRFLHPGEEQYFQASDDMVVCSFCGVEVGVAICADVNNPQHSEDTSKLGANIYSAGVAMTPNGIDEAESNLSVSSLRYGLLTVMANHASTTGGYSMAGRSAIWNEQGEIIAQAEGEGECLVIAEATPGGWRGHVAGM